MKRRFIVAHQFDRPLAIALIAVVAWVLVQYAWALMDRFHNEALCASSFRRIEDGSLRANAHGLVDLPLSAQLCLG
jgi:hypothetical protein